MTTFRISRRAFTFAAAASLGVGAAMRQAAAQSATPGVTDSEILLGQTMPYTGMNAAYGTMGVVQQAYFRMLNDQGGINGRKITLLSVDDSYSPPKAAAQVRELVEHKGVLLIFGAFGTGPNGAFKRYLNERKVPQLFAFTGVSKFSDPEQFPWTMPWPPSYSTEAYEFGRYLLRTKPAAKVALLTQDDDIGKDYAEGLKRAFGPANAQMIVGEATYAPTDADADADAQVLSLRDKGADTLVSIAGPKVAIAVIRKIDEIGWKPLHVTSNIGSSITAVLKPAGTEKAVGMITGTYMRDPADPATQATDGYKNYAAFMTKYYPTGTVADTRNCMGYSMAQTMEQTLRQCGSDLSRENVMRQAANLHDLKLPMLQTGVVIGTSPTDYKPIETIKLARFDGQIWVPLEPAAG